MFFVYQVKETVHFTGRSQVAIVQIQEPPGTIMEGKSGPG